MKRRVVEKHRLTPINRIELCADYYRRFSNKFSIFSIHSQIFSYLYSYSIVYNDIATLPGEITPTGRSSFMYAYASNSNGMTIITTTINNESVQ